MGRHMKTRLLVAGTLFAVGLAVASSALAAPNLIVNGGFEAPPQERGDFTLFGGGSSSLSGWEVLGPTRNAVALLEATYDEPNIIFDAIEGAQSLDISGGGNTGLESGVSQTVH